MYGRQASVTKLCLILFCCACAEAAQGQSFGRWDVPSTPCQFFGFGNSAGHHAPMVRTLGGRPTYVPRLAFVPPRERGIASIPVTYAYVGPGLPSASSSGNCGTHSIHHYSQHTLQHQPAIQHQPTIHHHGINHQHLSPPAATRAPSQPIFSAPTKAPAPKAKKPAVKPPVQKTPPPQKPAVIKKPQPPLPASLPRAQTPPQKLERLQPKPIPPTPKKETLPEPQMPTADPLASPAPSDQAWHSF